MSLSSILFLFLSHLAVGVLLSLLVVSREAGVRFFRFMTGLALAVLVIGWTLRPAEAASGGRASVEAAAMIVAMGALGAYWATVGRVLAFARPLLLGAAIVAGLAAVLFQALAPLPTAPNGRPALTLASFVSSSALLGGACTAMILGHWYLILPSMRVVHLQRVVKFLMGALVVRGVLVAVALWLAMATWEPLGRSFTRHLLSLDGLFFWQRVLFGLAVPAALSWLTWETAKIRSTQSATGILYVVFFTVIVGETLAKYLLLTTGVPF